jgi:peptidoglycan/xylan/chitin deacetylase (PgdA/CDA1 family)
MMGVPGMDFVTSPPPRLARRVLRRAEAALQWTGAAWAYTSARRPPAAAILNYHSVPGPDVAAWIDPDNAISPAQFEAQIRFLASRRRVVSLSELVRALERREPLRPGTVAITFDDGYRDFLTVAAPILERYRVPAIMFLPTGLVARAEAHWIDRLFTAFRWRTASLDSLKDIAPEGPGTSPLYPAIAGRLLAALPPERSALLGDVERRLAPARTMPRLTLNWDDVRELRDRFPMVEFGAHSVEHTDLSSCPAEIARWELTQAATDMEREISRRPEHLSFPYNRSSAQSRAAAIAAGYRSALANGSDPLVRPSSDRFALPRMEPPASMTMFRFMTGGAYPDLPRFLFGGRA